MNFLRLVMNCAERRKRGMIGETPGGETSK